MVQLTLQEKSFVISFGCRFDVGNVLEAFRDRFPETNISRATVFRLRKKFEETGSVGNAKRKSRTLASTVITRDRINHHFEANPHDSVRKTAIQLGLCAKTVHAHLKKQKFIPYKEQIHQKLYERDFGSRVAFCHEIENMIQYDEQYLRKIMWTDESVFHIKGFSNKQNFR